MYGRFFAGGVESGGIRIWERGKSTVVFVAGGGFVEGAFAEAGGEVAEETVGVSFGLAAAASLDAGDLEDDFAGLGVVSDELEEALLLAGGAAVLEGVEVAEWGAGVGTGTAPPAGGQGSGHGGAPLFLAADRRRWFVFSVG